jgi:hypothetical protein
LSFLGTDDAHRGHDSLCIENFLKQLDPPCHRVRIQGRCTKYIQPADTTWANKELNRLLCDEMRALKILESENGVPTYFTSLTVAGREYIGKFFASVKRKWETDEFSSKRKLGIIKAFSKTLLQLQTSSQS